MKCMRVLVACEYSGIVREAFRARGHDAWSCDILPSEQPGPHIQGDALLILGDGWDLMIAHPPCTYLSNAGRAHWNKPGRAEKRQDAADFFMALMDAPIPLVCVENPVGHMNMIYRKPDQIIHPYYFGDRELKKTCLWLRGLPKLYYQAQDDLFGKRTMTDYPEPNLTQTRKPSKNFKGGEVKKRYFTDKFSGAGSLKRAKTFPGIALAMAEQWG